MTVTQGSCYGAGDMSQRLLLFLTAANLLNYLDRYLVAAVLPVLKAEFSLTDEEGGQLVSAFVFGYFICSPIFGYLGDRFNRPRLMALGVFLWSLSCVLCAYAPTFTAFIVARVFIGVGEASFGTIAPGYIKDRINDQVRLNKALALFFCAIPVGAALGYVLAGYCTPRWGWHRAFVVAGALGMVLSPFVLLLKDPRKTVTEALPFVEGLRELARVPLLWIAVIGYTFNSFALNGIAAFVSSFGVRIGFALEEINFAFGMILVGAGFFGTVFGGWLSSRLAARSADPVAVLFKFIAVSALLGAPLLGVAFTVTDRNVFLVLCAAAELVTFLGVAAINAIVVTVAPQRLLTLAQGVTIFSLNLFGALLAPIAVGRVSDLTSLGLALQLCTGAMVISGVCWLFGTRSPGQASRA